MTGLFAVVTDGLDRAALKGLHAESDIFLGLRLLVDEGVTTLVVAAEKGRRGLATEIAVDALLIDKKLTGDVLLPLVCFVSHDVYAKKRNDLGCQAAMQNGTGFSRIRSANKVKKPWETGWWLVFAALLSILVDSMLSDRPYMRDSYERRPFPVLSWMLGILAAVFVLENVLFRWFSDSVGGGFIRVLALSPDAIAHGKVWTLATYALLHDPDGFLHIIGNLLGLYFLGRTLLPILGSQRFAGLCAASLIAGGLFWLGVNWTHGGILVGASAVVYGLFIFFACIEPDRPITLLLFFILPVTLKPKYIALGMLAIDACGVLFFELLGRAGAGIAHSAHLGGMAAGWLYFQLLYNRDSADSKAAIELPRWFRKSRKADAPPPAYKVNLGTADDLRAEIDRILDKINSEGFQSLTAEEKRRLDLARDHLSRR